MQLLAVIAKLLNPFRHSIVASYCCDLMQRLYGNVRLGALPFPGH